MASRRIQGWDPILIIAQIISLQSLHYLLLSILLPPLLATFSSSPSYLAHQGGATTVSSVMDWREMAGRQTLPPGKRDSTLGGWLEGIAWSGGRVVGGGSSSSSSANTNPDGVLTESNNMERFVGRYLMDPEEVDTEEGKVVLGQQPPCEGKRDQVWVSWEPRAWTEARAPVRAPTSPSRSFDEWEWDGKVDPRRGWIIAAGWGAASVVDVFFLYQFIRRPTHILDHALTLTFSHLLLTTYYAASFPTSFFWWLIVGSCTLGTIVMAEQLCVKREMMEDLGGDWSGNVEERGSGDHDRSNTDGLLAASRAGGEETIELLGVGRRGSKGGDEGPDDVGSAREPEGSSGSGWEGKDTGGGDGGPALMATSSSSRTTVTSGGKDGPYSRPRD